MNKITGTISYPDDYGVQARVGGKHVGYFSFSKYMNPERKAKAYLKAYIAIMTQRTPKPKANNTGVPGCSYSVSTRKGKEYGQIKFRVGGKVTGISCGRADAPDIEARKRKAIRLAKGMVG
jgi:hypothetical protein